MDKSWLMNPRVVSLIRSMRGHIQSEFGTSLSLTDDALYEQLCAYSDRSRNSRLQNLRLQLDEILEPPVPEPAPAKPSHVYRGQVMEPRQEPATSNEQEQQPKRPKRERVYRGQRIAY